MDKVYRVVFVKDYSLETFYTKANSKEEAKKQLFKKHSDIKEPQIIEVQNLKEKKASASFISFDFINYFKKVASDKAIRAMIIVSLLVTGAYFGAKKYGEYKRQKLAQEFFEEHSQSNSNEILQGSEGDEGEFEAKEDLKSAKVAKQKQHQNSNPYEGLPEHNTKEVIYNEKISQNKEVVKNNYSNTSRLLQQNSNQFNPSRVSKIEKISYQMKEINATKCATKYICIDVSLRYPVNIEIQGDKEVEAFIKNVVKRNIPKFNPDDIKNYYKLLGISTVEDLPPNLYYHYRMKIVAYTDKTITIMINTDVYSGGAHNNGDLIYINLSTDTFLEIKSLDEIVKSFKRKQFKKIAEHYFRLANNISKYTDLRKIGFYENKFQVPEHFYLGKDGIHLTFVPYEVASWGANGAYKAEFVVPYSAVEDMIYLDKIFINYNKGEKSYDNSVNTTVNSPTTLNNLAISNSTNKRVININRQEHLSNDKIAMDIKYKVKGERVYFKVSAVNSFANAKGGISVSIPGVRFKSDILQVRGRGFNSAKVYPAGSTIWNGATQSKMSARYVLIEGWAQKWQRGEQKVLEFSIDKSLIDKKSVNVRAVLVKNQQEYLLPTSGATDQQGYPVEQVIVYAESATNNVSSENKQNSQSTQNSSDKAALEQVLNSWNRVMNNKDTSSLEYLFANQLKYYGTQYLRSQAIKDKRRILAKFPDFSQQIKNITYEKITPNLYKLSFDKYVKVSSDSQEKLYPSYLYIKKINGEWRIVEEGDKVTDRILQEKRDNNVNKGLFVCYDKKEITANGVKYIGCQRFSTPCNSNNKLHFGKYRNSSDAQDALIRCKNSKPKFIDSGKR